METIYQSETPSKGIVEIFNLYGGNYYTIFCDTKPVISVYKDDFKADVLKRSFIKECKKISGVSEDGLQFVYIDLYHYSYRVGMTNYDSNEYFDNYGAIMKCIKNNGTPNSDEMSLMAIGIDELEEVIDNY